jgi:hypothetical protein
MNRDPEGDGKCLKYGYWMKQGEQILL